MAKRKNGFFYRNGLSATVFILMLGSLTGQFITGWNMKNDELIQKSLPRITMQEYAHSGHFIQAVFENWESEFLQMALYVVLTVYLVQKGSSESKDPDGPNEVDREPQPHPDAPWPVRRGGIWLKIYSHSLSMAFTILFVLSFVLHLYGSLKDHNEEQLLNKLPPDTWTGYILQARFWFESFQNWQSEFLSILSIVLFSIWLREKGSPESKPVDAPYSETGG